MPSSARRCSNECATSCSRAPELQGAAKERFAAIQERQAEAAAKVQRKRAGRHRRYAYYASAAEEIDGLPADVALAGVPPLKPRGKPATS